MGWDNNVLVPLYYQGLKGYVKDVLMLKDHPDNLQGFITQVREVNYHLKEQYAERKGQ